ncbi:ACT-domain-containing protein, predicted allosteric regulator of homoserine dehydrogenase [Methanocaldococcus lauensis]|uniref:ACT-domain-containing protein, predicted allosteric regulator of homoserine dehydrogenase n=1 Tax=Methanocaldococcus lauensis TaxID=2546128 RepID=A0A8D6PQD4_9EURY|nr:ACT domain-containing protein [Methanocaldococcus lauensis]CAB3287987.1 ACT-domain-containing protein, predicted allosteric regulator of homoserine dehydrogenase [Methanocaldococcus lauensis]
MITIDIELKDKPGELLKVLTPISKYGANIISVIHSREDKRGGKVPVRIVIDVEDSEKLKKILEDLEKEGAIIKKIDGKNKKVYLDVVVIGHVVDTDIKDTIDRINEIGLVEDLDLIMPHPDKESSAIMRIIIDKDKINELFYLFDKLEKEKNLFFIKSIL